MKISYILKRNDMFLMSTVSNTQVIPYVVDGIESCSCEWGKELFEGACRDCLPGTVRGPQQGPWSSCLHCSPFVPCGLSCSFTNISLILAVFKSYLLQLKIWQFQLQIEPNAKHQVLLVLLPLRTLHSCWLVFGHLFCCHKSILYGVFL